jgi:hypothetical protein
MRTENPALVDVEGGALRGVSGIGVARSAARRQGTRWASLALATRRETVDADAADWRTTRAVVAPTYPLL